MNATQMLQFAKTHSITGVLIKNFRNGQELREYQLEIAGVLGTFRIRAFGHEHA